MATDPMFMPHDNFAVVADAITGLIDRWLAMRPADLKRQPLAANEVMVPVDRQPNLRVDKYVNIVTGALRAEPQEQGA